jgi:hypothetical protein
MLPKGALRVSLRDRHSPTLDSAPAQQGTGSYEEDGSGAGFGGPLLSSPGCGFAGRLRTDLVSSAPRLAMAYVSTIQAWTFRTQPPTAF